MRLIDTHAHLDFPDLHARLDEVIATARQHGVARIIAVGPSRGLESNFRALQIARDHSDSIRATAGIHPHDASVASPEVIALIRSELAPDPLVLAIGEIGLDYHYNKSPVATQLEVFRAFLRMSLEVEKPVMIHSRDAEADTLRLLDEEGVRGGILHCFTGSRPFAEALLERDFYLSFSGIVTFKSGRELLEIARDAPEDRILVETDSPYLAPIPFRGKPNQPAYVLHTATAIAQIRDTPLEAFASASSENAARAFKWSWD